MPDGEPKAMRVIAGLVFMVGVVAIAFGIVLQYAGTWGVPYFRFSTDRGSTCTNNFTGYVCEPLTLADVEFYADLDLPADTRVLSGTYRSTHDYVLDARLRVPERSSATALTSLNAAFGPCRSGRPAPLDNRGLTGLCVMANDDAVTGSAEVDSRLYLVGTGVRRDGGRDIGLTIKSR
ncbi:MAG: hypothetical protein ACLGIF_07775 [Actinomycetes bacterium]